MSGVRRLAVGEITLGKLRGKPLADALALELNSEQTAAPKANTYAKSRKK